MVVTYIKCDLGLFHLFRSMCLIIASQFNISYIQILQSMHPSCPSTTEARLKRDAVVVHLFPV